VTTTQVTSGSVAAGFERVQEAFAAGAADLGDGGGAYCVYVGGEKVVDLWGGQARTGQPWQADTTAVLMSTTKGLTALCAQVLHDRGLLDVEAPVSTYWPEFACNGKEKATVRMVLDHTVGVLGLPDPGALLDWDGRGWDDYDAIAGALAQAPAAWKPGTRIGYHAITVGWLTGELVRRAAGVTIGQLLQEAVAGPLGVNARIGTPLDVQHLVATVIPEGYDGIPPEMVEVDRTIKAWFDDESSLLSTAAIHMHGSNVISSLGTFMNNPRALAAEVAAANGTAGAGDIARVYAMLANGGSLDGVRVVSPESIRLFSAVSAEGRSAITPEVTVGDLTLPAPWTCYGLGYARNVPEPGMPPAFGPNTETFGHAGHGGQVGFADPVRNLGVGFVRSHLSLSPMLAATLIATTYECLDALGG
jgi:CubicO group peptidase (beta-lactamase class C family)